MLFVVDVLYPAFTAAPRADEGSIADAWCPICVYRNAFLVAFYLKRYIYEYINIASLLVVQTGTVECFCWQEKSRRCGERSAEREHSCLTHKSLLGYNSAQIAAMPGRGRMSAGER
jgi:hypothetical protein